MKFKAWDIKNNCFSEEPFFRLLLTNNNKVYNSEKDEYSEIGEKYHICFSTGKKDTNGKEVYEGDVIEFDRTEWGGNDNIHVVSWNEKEAEWSFGGGCTSDMEFRTVIGNIYENPELLKTT